MFYSEDNVATSCQYTSRPKRESCKWRLTSCLGQLSVASNEGAASENSHWPNWLHPGFAFGERNFWVNLVPLPSNVHT